MRADLHSHSIYSDGELNVNDLLDRAINNKIDILALTDHDCFDGAIEAYNLSKDKNIQMVYGLELSTYRNDEHIHILAYYSKPLTSGSFYEMLENQRLNRKKRAIEICSLLKQYFNIEMDQSFICERHSISRGTIAKEIVKQGFAENKKEVFIKYIGAGCPCFLPSTKLSPEEGIKLILESGGMPVLAHPCLYKNNNVEDIIKMGVKGIEAVYPNTENRETKYRDLARKYKLIITGGSDFHAINDYGHGEIGEAHIKDQDLRKFLKVLKDEY